jgi:hypothetical protein
MGGDLTGKSTAATGQLSDVSNAMFGMTAPAMNTAMDMLTKMLKTGEAPNARTPQIGQAVEKSMQASSQAERSMTDDFARTGIAGTPFASSILGGMRQEGAQRTAGIQPAMEDANFWKYLAALMPGMSTGMGQSMQGFGGASSNQTAANSSLNALYGGLFDSTMDYFGTRP